MTIEIRPITADEWPAYIAVDAVGFAEEWAQPDIDVAREMVPLDRCLAALDSGRIVADAASFPTDLTVPGGSLRAAAVTMVAVVPTHRRQGLLTELMRRQLEEVRAAGEPLAALWATEAVIYGRFGYGVAAESLRVRIESSRSALLRAPETPGSVRMVEASEAEACFAPVYDALLPTRPGMIGRSDALWRDRLLDHSDRRGGASPLYHVVYEAAGRAEGYLLYRIKHDWEPATPSGTVVVVEMLTTTSDAYTALWRFCLSMDLTSKVLASRRPVDEPLPWMLVDRRRAQTERRDALWVRVVDVPAALGGRRYTTSGALTLEVSDAFCPWNEGAYLLEAGPEGAACARTDRPAELALDVADLGAVYLGGVSLSTLAAAGRVRELVPGAVRRADAMFSWSPSPWCPAVF